MENADVNQKFIWKTFWIYLKYLI